MSYFEPVANENGLNLLSENPCHLLDFRLLNLENGQTHEAASGDREILAVLLGGRADFTVNDHIFNNVGGRPNVFSGKPHAVYIPGEATFAVKGNGRVQIGLCSAPSHLQTDPYVLTPADLTAGVWGAANFSRTVPMLREMGH